MPPKKLLKAAPAADAPSKPALAPAPPVATAPAAAEPPASAPIGIPTTPPSLSNPETIVTYKALYDTLGRAYWEASDINAKDTIQGVRDAILASGSIGPESPPSPPPALPLPGTPLPCDEPGVPDAPVF